MTTEITAGQMAAHHADIEVCRLKRVRDAELLSAIRENMPSTRDEFIAVFHQYVESGGLCRMEAEFAAALLNTIASPSGISQFIVIPGFTEYDRYDPYYIAPVDSWLGKRGELDSRPRFNPIPQGW